MYLVIDKCVTAVKVSNFSGHYLSNHSTLEIGVWIISVYFNIRNTLPKSGTFLLGHPVYKTRLASNEIFSPLNKIHREVGLAKKLSAPLYKICIYRLRKYDLVLFHIRCSARTQHGSVRTYKIISPWLHKCINTYKNRKRHTRGISNVKGSDICSP